MRNLLLAAALALGLGGCSWWNTAFGPESETVTVQTVLTACDVYKNAFAAADLYDQAHPFTPDVVKKINDIDLQVEQICPPKGAMPTSLVNGLIIVVNGSAAIIAAYKGSN